MHVKAGMNIYMKISEDSRESLLSIYLMLFFNICHSENGCSESCWDMDAVSVGALWLKNTEIVPIIMKLNKKKKKKWKIR